MTDITVDSGAPQPVTLDANGSTISQGQNQFRYNAAGRLSGANGMVKYRYDGLGERVEKSHPKVLSWPLSILFGPDGDHDGDDTTKTGFVYGAPANCSTSTTMRVRAWTRTSFVITIQERGDT